LNSTTSNCVSIVVWAPPAVDPPAVDHDDPSASGFSSFLEDNIDGTTSNVNEEAHSKEIAKAAFLSRKISFIRQGILANKDLFLIDPTSHPDIDDLIQLKGLITNVPYKGSQEYFIEWDTSSLKVTLQKSSLCHTVVKNDSSQIVLLKLARFEFSYVHPDGRGGIVNVGVIRRNRRQRKKQRPSGDRASDTRNADVIRRNQQLANLRTSAVDSSNIHGNQPIRPGGVSTRSTCRNNSVPTEDVETDSDEEDGVNGESEEIIAEDLRQEELTEENLLHGYVHDTNYNPQNMEEDGEFVEDLEWEYHDVPTENLAYASYNGEGPSLRPGVAKRFYNVLDACAVAGGFSYDLIKRITAHSNASVCSKLVGYSFYGKEWRNI
jgi:hypothetical protein